MLAGLWIILPKEVTYTMDAVLQAKDLSYAWDKDTLVLDQINLSVQEGEIACIVGRSGSGKTTLLHALSGLIQPCAGKIILLGEDISGVSGKVGYMFQNDLLLPNKRILDNVLLPGIVAGKARGDLLERAEVLFDLFGLAGQEQKWPHELSGGMRQRAAFMRTCMIDSKALVMDEPFSALDAITRKELGSWYKDMVHKLGLACVFVTHNIDEAKALGDSLYTLYGNPAQGQSSKLACGLS